VLAADPTTGFVGLAAVDRTLVSVRPRALLRHPALWLLVGLGILPANGLRRDYESTSPAAKETARRAAAATPHCGYVTTGATACVA
jgi:hypothetical protein